jgi:hypothetical protein
MVAETDFSGIRGRRIEGVHRVEQGDVLFSSRYQLELQGQFHASKYRTYSIYSQSFLGVTANEELATAKLSFLRSLKEAVSRKAIL